MLEVGVVTLFPDMIRAVTDFGISARAIARGLVRVSTYNPRDWTRDAHRTVDDRPYGGGPGMVMMVEPLRRAIAAARSSVGAVKVIFLSPQGRRITQRDIIAAAGRDGFILVAGRYEGVDQRIIEMEADEEWSIGDYVLSGGELAAMVIIDAACRLLPGALGHEHSADQDSFMAGLLDYPHYTRPESIDGRQVPPVLLSGNHEAIREWRLKQSLGRTWIRRPDLLRDVELAGEHRRLLQEFMDEQVKK